MFPLLFSAIIFPVLIMQGITSHNPQPKHVLAQHEMSLDKRYQNKFVNDVFKDNILLDIAYMAGKIDDPKNINWTTLDKPFHYELVLKPQQTFAFHDALLPQYQNKSVITAPAHFDFEEGFKSDGYLTGDGVCHLASLIDWASRDAGLVVDAPTSHDFANIPEIPKAFGVAIYSEKGDTNTSAQQNLYVTNNKDKPVYLVLDYKNNNLQASVSE